MIYGKNRNNVYFINLVDTIQANQPGGSIYLPPLQHLLSRFSLSFDGRISLASANILFS